MVEETKVYKKYSAVMFERNGGREVLLVLHYGEKTIGNVQIENDPVLLNQWSQKMKEMNEYLQNLSKT